MSENGHARRCIAITKAGEQCQLSVQADSDFCHIHQEHAPSAAIEPEPTPSADEARAQLQDEIRRLTEKVETQIPVDRRLRPLTPAQVVEAIGRLLSTISARTPEPVRTLLPAVFNSDWMDPETWRGMGYVVQIAIETQIDMLRRRRLGQYEVDPWGYDAEFANLVRPLASFFYKHYWRIEMAGLDNIPNVGRALLVANHSGVLPLDGAMIAYGVSEHHVAGRLVRTLVANLFPSLPFFSVLANRTGQVLAHPENGARLLDEDELVLVFPEGYKGTGKPFHDRYKLARFGRGGFVNIALQTGAPILPVSVVGAEETYPMLANVGPLARLLGLPYFPITPLFPWLGLLGLVPLPSKWYIDIGAPIEIGPYDSALANNPVFVSELNDLVRNSIQAQLDQRLDARPSIFR